MKLDMYSLDSCRRTSESAFGDRAVSKVIRGVPMKNHDQQYDKTVGNITRTFSTLVNKPRTTNELTETNGRDHG